MPEAKVVTVRRYYLLKSQALFARWEEGLAAAYLGRLAQTPGTPLPVGFPFLAALAAAAYTCVEDLDGASHSELMRQVPGITNRRDADLVLVAWSKLTPPTLPEIQPTSG